LHRPLSPHAPILVHGIYNTAISYPALGQFMLRRDVDAPGDPGTWALNLICLAVVLVAIPAYVFMSRDSASRDDEPQGELLPR
jgi:hypothetical protein